MEPLYFVLIFIKRILLTVAACLALYPGMYFAAERFLRFSYSFSFLAPFAMVAVQIASALPMIVMVPVPGGLPLIGATLFAVFQPVWAYVRRGQTDSARLAGIRDVAAAGGGPPPPAAAGVKGALLALEGCVMFVALFAIQGLIVGMLPVGPLALVPYAAAMTGIVAAERGLISLLDGPLGVAPAPA